MRGKHKASYISGSTNKRGHEKSEDEAILEQSEECVPLSSFYRYDENGQEEEDPEEEPSEEPEEDQEDSPSDKLLEDPEEDSGEELKDDSEEESVEALEEDPEEEEDLEEESDEEQTDKPSDSISPSLLNRNNGKTGQPIEDSLEDSLSEPSFAGDTNEAEHQSGYVSNNSNERKKLLDSIGELAGLQGHQSDKKCGQVESSNQQEDTRSSGKQRRSRWEQSEGDEGAREYNHTGKRRKTRWASDDSQLKMLGSIKLPDFMKEYVAGFDLDPEIKELRAELSDINNNLRKPVLLYNMPGEERSPSPEPVYNDLGIRINTQEVRLRQKLMRKRERVMSKLSQKILVFKPPSDHKSTKLIKKLYIPVEQYPGYNFIGLIIGPQGKTQKKMEKETGASIMLRGKGSSLKEKCASENENLHIRIEADNQKSLDAAVEMIEKLLIPIDDRMNAHKRAQLEELAKLKSTSKDPDNCSVCGVKGHQRYACPCLQSTFKIAGSCTTCGGNSHLTASCPLTASSNHSNSQHGSFGIGLGLTLGTQSKANDANLFVGSLPKVVDENRLKELFSPFGKIVEAKVIKDRTTGLSKGYGFVKFETSADAAAALSHMDRYKMDGKLLSVRLAGRQPVVGSSILNNLPQYPVPAAVPQSQIAWPDPQKSWLPENQYSFAQNKDVGLLSSSSYAGHSNLLSKSEDLVFTPPPGISSLYYKSSLAVLPQNVQSQIAWPDPQKSWLAENQVSFAQNKDVGLLSSSSYGGHSNLLSKTEALVFTPPSRISSLHDTSGLSSLHSFSSAKSTAQFPADPDYQLPSYFTTSTTRPSSLLHHSQISGSNLNPSPWPTGHLPQ